MTDESNLSINPYMIDVNQLPNECIITQEDVEEIQVERAGEDMCITENLAEDESSKKSTLFDSEDGPVVNIRQIASVLLSDTSESGADGDDEEYGHLDEHSKQQIQEEMCAAIKTQIIQNELVRKEEPFMKAWIEQQKKMCMVSQENINSTKHANKRSTTEGDEGIIDDVSKCCTEIPKVTELNVRSHYSRKHIEEVMVKMDKEKRERWEKLFMQFELRKSLRAPVLKSDFKGDFKKLQDIKGKEDLVQYYKTALNNLKEDVQSSVTKLEQIMSDLETREQVKSQGLHQNLSVDEVQDDTVDQNEKDQKSESTEWSSDSEDELLITEQQMDAYEEILSKNIVVAPNMRNIKKLLNVKIVFPEAEKETVKLGRTLRDVEQSILHANGLGSYVSRIVYFFTYRSSCDARFIKTAYEFHKSERVSKETVSHKGCLLIYENVNMAIVMVEGSEFELLKHMTEFKSSLSTVMKRGKILYIHRNLLKLYFNKWVTRIESPPAGKITYLTKSKKVMYRTAASRVVRVSEMLHKLYRHLSKEERYLVDPRSIYIKSKYLVMLPSPWMFGYLMKYKLLRDLQSFIDDIGLPLELSSDEEELFAFTEDVMYSNYIDTDEEDDIKIKKFNYAKDIIRNGGDASNIKCLNDLKIKETGEVISWENYLMDEITPTIIDGRIKLSEEADHPAVRLASAMEAHQHTSHENKRSFQLPSRPKHELLTFLERGSDSWNRKINWHGMHTNREVVNEQVVETELVNELNEMPNCALQSSEEENLDYDDSYTEESSSESSRSNQDD